MYSFQGVLNRLGLTLRRMSTVAVVAVAVIMIAPPPSPLHGQSSPQQTEETDSSKLCYTFLREGDVWIACNGVKKQIPLGGRVLHYAISSDGSSFAFLRKLTLAQKAQAPAELVVVSLSGEFKTTTSKVQYRWLRPTCGTILAYRVGWNATDLLTGRALMFPPNTVFQCDSDRRVVLGWDQLRGSTSVDLTLQVNGKPDQNTIRAYINGGQDLDVSPSGEYLAYFREPNAAGVEVCVTRIGEQPKCAEGADNEVGIAGLSLSDSGSALYTGGTGASCFYKDTQHFATKPLSGYSEEDECPGIYFWRPGMQRPQLIQDLGQYVQWITPLTASALRRWNSSLPAH
jgi:hypothetical protein